VTDSCYDFSGRPDHAAPEPRGVPQCRIVPIALTTNAPRAACRCCRCGTSWCFRTWWCRCSWAREKSISALEEATGKGGYKEIFLSAQRKAKTNEPVPDDIFTIGTVGTIIQLLRLPDGTVKVLVEGKRRAAIRRFTQTEGFFTVEIEEMPDAVEKSVELDALIREVHATFESYVKLNKRIAPEILISVQTIEDPGQLADTMVGQLQLKLGDKQSILEMDAPSKRLSRLYELMKAEIEILQVERKIRTRVKKQMEKTQKEYYLNEQMQAIQKELGDRDEFKNELTELEERAKQKNLSKEAQTKVKKELKKLRMMAPLSAEAAVVRNYVDWVLGLPWGEKSEEKLDVVEAERILDQDHYGLKKVKERILEYLAVQALVKKLKGAHPVSGGPARRRQDVAGPVDRPFDGAQFRAAVIGRRARRGGDSRPPSYVHRRAAGKDHPVAEEGPARRIRSSFSTRSTRCPRIFAATVGGPAGGSGSGTERHLQRSLPGPGLRPQRRDVHNHGQLPAGHSHPAAGPHGDHPAARVTPSSRRCRSPRSTSSQAEARQRHRRRGRRFSRGHCSRRHPLLHEGSRGSYLEREIATVCRKIARDVVAKKVVPGAAAAMPGAPITAVDVKITPKRLPRYLGPHRYRYGRQEGEDEIGLVNGLAVTMYGGDLLATEVSIVAGKGKLVLTGKLGDVMQESAQAALSYVRSRAPSLGLERDFYSRADIHVHLPEGAIPRTDRRRGSPCARAWSRRCCACRSGATWP